MMRRTLDRDSARTESDAILKTRHRGVALWKAAIVCIDGGRHKRWTSLVVCAFEQNDHSLKYGSRRSVRRIVS